MNKFITAVAVTAFVASAAFAVESTTGAVAPTEAVAPAGGGQSTVAAAEVKAAAPAKRFSARITDRASFNARSANLQSESTEASGAMDPRISYKLNDTTSAGLGTTILHSYGTTATGKAAWTVSDIFGQVQNSNTATILGNKFKAGGRLYVPTSEVSQAAGQLARVRADLTLERALGPVTLSYYASPQFYFQRNNTYTNAKGQIEATRNFRYLHYIGAAVQITPKLSAYSNLGLDQAWFNDEPSQQIAKNARTKSDIYAETAFEYAINDNIGVAVGVEQYEPDMLAQTVQGPIYRDEYTSYFLEGTVSF